jgi:uncharacterized lipoprotein
MKIRTLTTLIFTAFLAACSSAPTSVIIAPQVNVVSPVIYIDRQATLTVNDLRTQNHVIQILKADQAAELLSPANDVAATLNQSLSEQWKKQGLTLVGSGAIEVTVFIDAALVSVQQETVKYTAQSEIRLRVQIQKGEKTLTNHFKSNGNSNGPLYADVAVLERDFNQQLGKVIEELMANKDMQSFIKE